MILFITGAAGFIGSSFLRVAKNHKTFSKIVVLDALTYAGRMENIDQIIDHKEIIFEKVDIRNFDQVSNIFDKYNPTAVAHFAAESHVDNSISGPRIFIETNVLGTLNVLEASRATFQKSNSEFQNKFRFVHVSTDEVFGQLGDTGFFNEQTPYQPSSPYSASKAGSDHLARAWWHTYKLPTIVTNCSNNYGPRQFPEKLIPRIILNCLSEKKLPVYGQGINVRDWIYVDDHSEGVWLALTKGLPGETYCLGGNSERKNIDVVKTICKILNEKRPRSNGEGYENLIEFVEDRKGHDFRYAIDDMHAIKKLGYTRRFKTFEEGLESTINWYLENTKWVSDVSGHQVKGNL
jgi:dTDP-glucose 4,6-dehydratase